MPSPSGRTWRPNNALMLSGRWFVYWSSLNFFFGSFFCWGIFLSIPSFAYKNIAGVHLFFDFVEHTHVKLLHRLVFSFETYFETHVGLWRKLGDFYLMFLELSCIMWMLESVEFGVCTLELHYAACTCASGLIVCKKNLLINMVGVASRNLGWGCGWVQAHYYCKWAKSFDIGFNSLSSACNCSVFVAKCFLNLINLDSQIMLYAFCLVAKSLLLI